MEDAPVILPVAVLTIVNKFVPDVVRIPDVSARVPESDTGALKETPFALLMVKLFNVEALVPPMVCRALPLKFIVPLFAVNVPLLLKLPAKFIVPEVATSVPALAVRLLSVTVLLPKLKVPLPAFVKFKVPVESVPPTVSMFALTVT